MTKTFALLVLIGVPSLAHAGTGAIGGGCNPKATLSAGTIHSCITSRSTGQITTTTDIKRTKRYDASCSVRVRVFRYTSSGTTLVGHASFACPALNATRSYAKTVSVGTGRHDYKAFWEMYFDGSLAFGQATPDIHL